MALTKGLSMPSATPVLKRQNHRIHPCNATRKNDLLAHLIAEYAGKSILIVTANDPADVTVPEDKNITLTSDELLAQMGELTCDILISYDLPDKAIIYMSRFARAREYALILLSAEDQKFLYPIETLQGRTITQEAISGYEPDFGIAVEQKSKEEAAARRAEREAKAQSGSDRPRAPRRDDKPRGDRPDFKREERGSRDDARPPRKPFSDSKPGGFDKKDSKPRFVGKDENGKPIFEGKTRERNHYHDGNPRTDAEKAARTPYSSKPKFFNKDSDKPRAEGEKAPFSGERKPYDAKKPYEKKPYEGKKTFENGEKKPYDAKKPFGEKKPYDAKKPFGEKKPYEGKKPFDNGEKKPYDAKKPFGEKKPYDAKKPFGEKKPYGDKKPYDKKPSSNYKPAYDSAKPAHTDTKPARAPRRINVKSLTPTTPSEDKKQ
jgi:hypothetical protein